MAPNRGRDRGSQFEKLVDDRTNDFDPEEDHSANGDGSDSDSDVLSDENGAREHYVDVGKSKLRQPKEVTLGPQYRGSKISRNALQDDEDEVDPFSQNFSDEDDIDSDGSDGMEEDSDIEDADESEEADQDRTTDTDLSDEEEQNSLPKQAKFGASVKEQLRKGLNGDAQRAITASILQANKADAEKGRAVKRQRAAFDSLLNTRMKMQRSLVATNTLAGLSREEIEAERESAAQALEAAETAAFRLWHSLTGLREDIAAARTGQKRKRANLAPTAPTEDLIAHMAEQEAEHRPLRNAVIRKWSDKSQGPTVLPERSRLNQSDARTTIIDVLQEQLSNTERLVKRTHAPRSCAPLQLSRRVTEDDSIYDDADFYSLLLKELLEQKSHDSAAASHVDLGFQMHREAKTRRSVDTKASKGRKLRYTVHEKLQNFMAPEDRSAWGERQADDLFRSLFGQKLGLGEDDRSDEFAEDDEDEDDATHAQDAGLMLFRS